MTKIHHPNNLKVVEVDCIFRKQILLLKKRYKFYQLVVGGGGEQLYPGLVNAGEGIPHLRG